MSRVCIPDYEYVERIKKAAKLVADAGLDVMIVNSTESDYADVRYFSNFWPLFERAGVAIAANGDAALMCGPESRIFAADRSHIQKIFPSLYYRESANPAYPEFQSNTYRDVFAGIGVKGDKIKIGVSGYLTTTAVMMDALRADYPNAEIRIVDEIMVSLRQIKSENELACMREGFRIVELATKAVLDKLRPGVTELAMVGVAQQCIYENGAEYEGLPMYVFSEKSTSHAISRPGYRVIGEGDIVQLNLSAKVDGYAPSVGIPVCVGKLTPEKRRYVEFCLEAHNWTERQLRAGILASSVAKGFYDFYKDNGFEKNFVYGPCHGTGLIEVEAPWMETSSDYILQPNMTFQVDTFLSGPSYGMRWEKGIVIRDTCAESLCAPIGTIYEL
ncbi:MAG: M24 family metallopeptidase [Clostridiaceae bacterium]|nr:M24 family metallopeptidase [Clostridiaceae bacterium]